MTTAPLDLTQKSDDDEREPLLAGVRVIDLASVIMAPYACQVLGDLGADVIKVEPPTGDVVRRLQRRDPSDPDSTGAIALNLNRNKRSVRLDLKSDEGRAALLDLVATADVLVTNMRPGALARLHLTHEDLAEVNPRLVYCNAQGFRSDSTAADSAAYDEVVQAASGMVDLMRRTTGEPSYAPTAMADKICGLTIVYSVLAALLSRQRTGRGQRVEVPMADTMFAFTLVEHLGGRAFEPQTGPVGFPRSLEPGHAALPTADGFAAILPYSWKNCVDFFELVGHPEEMDAFEPQTLQHHLGDLYAAVARYSRRHTTAQWRRLCSERSIPFAPVMDLDHAGEHDYWADGHMLDVVEHPTEGPYRLIGSPVRFSGATTGVRRHSPALGQHTDEVLAELGWTPDRLAALHAREGAVPGSGR
ncbi:CaiB/BaiF CoA transferase family protein [Quadrisphaera oryzae]|uniref:CaiB/BaiF CoA transferase family protein n=1 Tax=Quadrisphaera TaxID=317661 RepID=UPI001C96D313